MFEEVGTSHIAAKYWDSAWLHGVINPLYEYYE
jgi:hypothetical protein